MMQFDIVAYGDQIRLNLRDLLKLNCIDDQRNYGRTKLDNYGAGGLIFIYSCSTQSTIRKKMAACTFSEDALPMSIGKLLNKDDTRSPNDEKF